jgi:hypothetical protein
MAYITRYGVCWPPAPTACMAFHNPGAVKAAIPTMVAWKKTPRYQLYLLGAVVDSLSSLSSWFDPVILVLTVSLGCVDIAEVVYITRCKLTSKLSLLDDFYIDRQDIIPQKEFTNSLQFF